MQSSSSRTTSSRFAALRAAPWRAMLAAFVVLAVTATTHAQNTDDPAELLENFVHYTKIARTDLARGNGQALLESGLSNAELAVLLEDSDIDPQRFDSALERALYVPELADIVGEIGLRIEKGRLDLARESDRIAAAIQMLSGTQRQQLIAKRRLAAAGEYAVPALLKVITDNADPALVLAAQQMLVEIGRVAVGPLSEALPEIDSESQRIVIDLLGTIGYAHAIPPIVAIANQPNVSEPVVAASDRALDRLGASNDDLSTLYTVLGQRYYASNGSLIAYPFEATNNVWSYDPFVGLVATPVPTEIYGEVMSMRMTERALALDAHNHDALGLYVASNLKRENDLPAGEMDPIYGDRGYTPAFYGTLFGTDIALNVLGLAIDTTDTPLVRDAIAALAETTGGAALLGVDGPRQPLLEALDYPDRRVQLEAALTLARALPEQSFDGDYRVVPILASAVRLGGQSFALVISDNEENKRQEAAALEALGYTVIAHEASVMAAEGQIADAVAIDLAVVRMSSIDAARAEIDSIRTIPKTAATPVVVIALGVDAPELKRFYHADPMIAVTKPVLDPNARDAILADLLSRATGGRMTEAEAEAYAFDALGALEDIAIANTPAYSIVDAEVALSDALDQRTGRARLLVARILARIDSDRTQRQLFDAALDASGGEQIDLLDITADSVRRFGDRIEPHHLAGLIDLIKASEGATAEAAARLHGSLNLRATDAVRLIFGEDDGN